MNKIFSRWSMVLPGIFLLLSACVQQPDPAAASLEPVQSPNDDRQYRYITLENGLRALLISDADTEKAAASLDVFVGSAQNPKDRAGLAHFLEHMLFLGTDKYPDPAEYEEFVTEHGGARNAYTGFEHTNYFFDIDQEDLAPALDRFAQFFISPRFDEEYVGREVNAVEAEYQMGIKTDGRRTLDVLREIVNQDHPFSILGVGTGETLGSVESPVRDDLLKFYERYYSANLMSLVVLGRESPDALENMVREMFSEVPNRGVEVPDITAPLYKPGTLPGLVYIEPEASERQVQLSFPMPDFRDNYRRKSVGYLGNLLGHEGEGSLLSVLKAEGWAEALGAGAGLSWRGGSAFSVSITLTEEGLVEQEAVFAKFFEYLEMLRKEGPRKSLYSEQARISDQHFRFRESSQPMRYVSALASDMHYYSAEDVLRGGFLMTDFDAAEITGLLQDYLVPENAMAMVVAKGVSTDRQSEFYSTPYSLHSVDPDTLWMQPPGSDARLHLPEMNAFVAEEVELKPRQKDGMELPARLVDEPNLSLWFHQDNEYLVPRGAMYLSFRNAQASSSARQVALGELYVSLLRDSVNEITYPAALAGLNFSFYRHARGISLKISGYDDKQLVLLETIIGAIKGADFDAARFANIKADQIRSLENVSTSQPFRQVMARSRQLLSHGDWDEQALIAELESVSLEDIEAYAANFWSDVSADVMLNGNYDASTVAGLRKQLPVLLSNNDPTPVPPLVVARLNPGQNQVYPVTVHHEDSVLFHYVQAPSNDWAARAQAALSGQIFKSGFFQQLRTEQQLGYVVSAFYWPILDVPGNGFMVQSPTNSAVDVAEAVNVFLQQSLGEDGLTEEQFLRHRKALIGEILQPYKNLWEQSEFYWREISKRELNFDSRKQLAEEVAQIEFEQWRDRARIELVQNPAQMRVVAEGRWQIAPVGEAVTSSKGFQKEQSSYQVR
jgi:insulysin